MQMDELVCQLNEKFSSKSVIFGCWKDSELPTAFIANKFCRGAVTLYGGHVLSYEPEGEKDLLWISKKSLFQAPKGIRGGIPVCWPWFGGNPQPGHGIARIQFWNMVSATEEADGSTTIVMHLDVTDPHDLSITLRANFGAKLTVETQTVNNSDEPYVLTGALHTYFNIGEIGETFVEGLGGAKAENRTWKKGFTCEGTFGFDAEHDYVYSSTSNVIINDKKMGRKILVEKSGSGTTVVWNPWIDKSKAMPDFGDEEYHTMLCVEAANCYDNFIRLEKGQFHKLSQTISLL